MLGRARAVRGATSAPSGLRPVHREHRQSQLEQSVIEDKLYAAAERNGLIAADGERQLGRRFAAVSAQVYNSRSIWM